MRHKILYAMMKAHEMNPVHHGSISRPFSKKN